MPLVTVWTSDSNGEHDMLFEELEVDFVSFVNHETHGIPALLAGRAGANVVEATKGQKILYVNTDLVPLMEVTK